MSERRYSFVYQSNGQAEDAMFRDLDSILAELDLDTRTRQAFRLVVSEAFTNALEHGNGFDPAKSVYVDIRVNDRELRADIEDEGERPVNLDFSLAQPESESEGGRGLALMRYHADSVTSGIGKRGGTRVSFGLALKGARSRAIESIE